MMQEQQQRPKVTRRHDCKNFFNVVSSQEKLDLIRMVTGATVTVDASLSYGFSRRRNGTGSPQRCE